ncbi:lysylphosphatidylglycerol synthase domain-containing protein [Rhizobium sp. SG2393]|uniref:lysylphosphatidylglycerol synthase domain-containing protein n=1 Tax=Rhizobium sp. SG2393 TaxID=3276279 RepID=UPI003670C887
MALTSKRSLFNIVMVVATLGAMVLVYRGLSRYSWDEIWQSLSAISAGHMLGALGFMALSYVALTFFDYLGLRYAGHPLTYWKAAIASFSGLAIGHNVGVAALSSGAVRYRFYSRFGLSNEEIAKVILFCGVTVGVGLISLAGISLLFLPDLAGRVAGLGNDGARIAGIVCLLIIAAYLAAAAFVRGTVTIRKWTFDMPGLPLALGQVAVGTANFVFVAACLHQLVGGEAGFGAVTAAYVVGNLAAVVSHVPGGIGVLEATISYVMGGAASIGALIAFRVIYFFLPLPFGLLCLFGGEIANRVRGAAGGEMERPAS